MKVGEEDHFAHLFNYVPPSGEGVLLLELRRGTQQLRSGEFKDTVRVYLDGEEVGGLTPASGAHFTPTLRHLEDFDYRSLVWGRIQGSALKAALTIQAALAHEIPDTWLQQPPQVDYNLTPEDDHYALPTAYVPTAKEQAEQRRRDAEQAQRRQREAVEPPAPAPAFPVPTWIPDPARAPGRRRSTTPLVLHGSPSPGQLDLPQRNTRR